MQALIETGHAHRTTRLLANIARSEHTTTHTQHIRIVHHDAAIALNESNAMCPWCQQELKAGVPFGVIYRRPQVDGRDGNGSPLVAIALHLNCMKWMEDAMVKRSDIMDQSLHL